MLQAKCNVLEFVMLNMILYFFFLLLIVRYSILLECSDV